MKKAIFAAACIVGLSSSAFSQSVVQQQSLLLKAEATIPAGYPAISFGDWEYQVLEVLAKSKLIDWNPAATYAAEQMTRYEFAVAVARLLESWNLPYDEPLNPREILSTQELRNQYFPLVEAKAHNLSPALNASALTDGIIALRWEFAHELRRLNERDGIQNRVTFPENRVPPPPKQTLSLGLLHRAGYGNYANAQKADTPNQPPTPAAPINPPVISPAPEQPTAPTPNK